MKFKQIIYALCASMLCIVSANGKINKISSNKDSYLHQPTGQYQVGFEDIQWVDNNICSSSLLVKNDCHKVRVKIYYPSVNQQTKRRALYNQSYMRDKQKEILDQIPNIPKNQIGQLTQIKSYSIEDASVIKGKKFPVLILSPGGGSPAELYENFITELVSHGYIIIGINTQFTGDTKSDYDIEHRSIPFDTKVLIYVYEKIHSLHNSNSLFLAMDLNHIGLFGHSIGGKVLADVVHAHPGWFQAAVTLDIGFDKTGASRKRFDIPFMHQIAANTMQERQIPLTFELGKNNFLVVLSPSKQNHDYSHHMNFTDLSTLQYLPAVQSSLSFLKDKTEEKFDIKFMSHSPTMREISNFDEPTYVLINKGNKWDIEYFKIKTDEAHPKRGPYQFIGGIESFKGLGASLAKLSNKNIELLSNAEIEPIKKILIVFQHGSLEKPFGTGNGREITSSINTYLLEFFDMYLKNQKNFHFIKCLKLTDDTILKCGPGTF